MDLELLSAIRLCFFFYFFFYQVSLLCLRLLSALAEALLKCYGSNTVFIGTYFISGIVKDFFYFNFFRPSLSHKDNHYFAGHAWHFQLNEKLFIYVNNNIIIIFQEPQNLSKNICVFLASWFFSLQSVSIL